MFRCLTQRREFETPDDFRAYAYFTMRSVFVDKKRREHKMPTWRLYPESLPTDDTTDQRAIVSSYIQRIKKLRDRSVCIDSVILYALGNTPAEIAESLGVPYGTVTRRISKGREIIAKELKVNKR